MSRYLQTTSKFLSYVLRHKPDTIGLTLDSEGWADITQLIRLANGHGTKLTMKLLLEVVSTCDKQRFALNPDGTKIRANQGHSLQVNLNLQQQTPPQILFHGTALRFVSSIRAQGLVAGSRQYVHLSVEKSTAIQVGRRYGEPILIEVEALAMSLNGHEFFKSVNGIWLTRTVPTIYLRFPDVKS